MMTLQRLLTAAVLFSTACTHTDSDEPCSIVVWRRS